MRLPGSLAMVLVDGIAPSLIRWAETQERKILREGRRLDEVEMKFAAGLGIAAAEEVRVMEISPIPLPVPPGVVAWARRLGLPVFAPVGMALGKGVYLLPGHAGSLKHELVHVAQYQRLGGVEGFMKEYLRQCLTDGYANAPLEAEARRSG